MDGRTTSFCVFLSAVVVATTGCGFNQQSKFQMSFLPPAPHNAPAIDFAEPPPVEPNLYLKASAPAVVLTSSSVPRRRTEADSTIQNAERAFQTGRRFYQAQDLTSARREFDRAIDLMLEAGD